MKTWEDFQQQRFRIDGEIKDWVGVKELIGKPIVVLDAFTYHVEKTKGFAAHDEARFAFRHPNEATIYASSTGWLVCVNQFKDALEDGLFPGTMPTVFEEVEGQENNYYIMRSPRPDELPKSRPARRAQKTEELPEEFPF